MSRDSTPRGHREFPSIEPLECRIAPAVILVTNFTDTPSSTKTVLDLRQALAQADMDLAMHAGVINTIEFKLPAPTPATAHTGTIITLTGGVLTSNGDVNIVGPGAGKLIIDGGGSSPVLGILNTGSTADRPVTISGLSIMHGNNSNIGGGGAASSGGGIYSYQSLTLKNVVISGNTTTANMGGTNPPGGGVSVIGSSMNTGTKVSLINCLITDNSAQGEDGGLHIVNAASITISKTVISGNTSTLGRGAGYLSLSSKGTGIAISGSVISGNSGVGGGGLGIYNYSTAAGSKVTITGTNISGNTDGGAKATGGGGLLLKYGNVVITGSTIANNTTAYFGGGIDAYELSSLTISKCTITGNKTPAATQTGQGGGGIFIAGPYLATPAPVTIAHSTISDNQSGYDGGGILASGGVALTISKSTITGNRSSGSGGGVATSGTGAYLTNLTVSGGKFVGNRAAYGGGISAYGAGFVSISGATISGNTAESGGGISAYSTDATNGVTITNVVAAGNTATAFGGALNLFKTPVAHLTGGAFTGNTAQNGGGVYVSASPVKMTGLTISGNYASLNGGGVDIQGSSGASVQIAKVTGNTAPTGPNTYGAFTSAGPAAPTPAAGHSHLVVTSLADSGPDTLRAALATADLTPTTVDTITFALPANELVNGAWTITLGGTPLSSLGNVNIVGPGAGKLIISGNNASGVFDIHDSPGSTDMPVAISGLSIINGSAHLGGGIYSDESLTLRNVVISGNNAPDPGGGGGGLAVTAHVKTRLSIIDSLITGNSTLTFGGGVAAVNLTSVSIIDSVVTGNTATGGGGGGIYASVAGPGASLSITGCLIANNSALAGGGLTLNDKSPTPTSRLTISGTRITGNFATTSAGGGLVIGQGNTVITGSIIEGNTAFNKGGGVYAEGFAFLVVSGSDIVGNQTTGTNGSAQGGGGLFINGSASETAKIIGSDIGNNNSVLEGGGVMTTGKVALTVTKSLVTGNDATDDGGGIYTTGAASLAISAATITGNTAKYGAGLETLATAPVTISGAIISGNIASVTGGGFYIGGAAGPVKLQNNIVIDNNAVTGAGGFILSTSGFAISGGIFAANAATTGGGLDLQNSTGSILGAVITDNTASNGGGIFNNTTTADAVTLQIAKVFANSAPTGPDANDTPGNLGTFKFV